MNVKLSLLCLSFCFAAAVSMSISDSEWINFKNKFNKTYNSDEESVRKENFKKNAEKIARHNERYDKKEIQYKLGINQFADLNDTEISNLKGLKNLTDDFKTKQSEHKPMYNVAITESIDWRNNVTFSQVKNKGECKSDWAFTAIGMLEAYLYRKTNHFTPLSEQDLIECSGEYGNNGCNGGQVENAVEYVKIKGISNETSYPFEGEEQTCKENVPRDGFPEHNKIACKRLAARDEGEMKFVLVKDGPLAAKMYAPSNFFFYQEGIFTGEDCQPNDETDYNVLIVGYNSPQESGEKYWIVKNWLGKDWGEQGYARIALGQNTCGIATKVYKIGSQNDEE